MKKVKCIRSFISAATDLERFTKGRIYNIAYYDNGLPVIINNQGQHILTYPYSQFLIQVNVLKFGY